MAEEKVDIPDDYLADMRWAREHSTELHEQFLDMWVAVVDQEVVASSQELGQAKTLAAERTGRKPEEVYVEFIDSPFAIYGQS
ncbi:MAG: DUF5678 domain-containing protein [Planctomycetota bacterium]|jgi:hypothetical protein|nr:DUF5678 domain-containing protein [Planctomycetota bacterium]MDP7130526.1 DUF5678 domain-containing protein [Planctomycetota bacterium]